MRGIVGGSDVGRADRGDEGQQFGVSIIGDDAQRRTRLIE